MKIEFIKPDKVTRYGVKVSLQKNGRLIFNKGAIEKFSIDASNYFRVGVDTENLNEKAIYLQKTSNSDVLGKRVYSSAKKLVLGVSYVLNELGIDYKNKVYATEVSQIKIDDIKFVKVFFIENSSVG